MKPPYFQLAISSKNLHSGYGCVFTEKKRRESPLNLCLE